MPCLKIYKGGGTNFRCQHSFRANQSVGESGVVMMPTAMQLRELHLASDKASERQWKREEVGMQACREAAKTNTQ